MSKNDDQGRLPPPQNTTLALREGESFPDPIEALTSGLGDDPALGDLIAFRQSRPDLKEAARMSRQCAGSSKWGPTVSGARVN